MRCLFGVLLAVRLIALAEASFWVYTGLQQFPEVGVWRVYWFFRGQPSCDDVKRTQEYDESDDVSGSSGVVCDGRGCGGDPQLIDRLEFNTDFGHYSKR
jgi:hypothetical protein